MTIIFLTVPQLIPANWEITGDPVPVLEGVNQVYMYNGWQGGVIHEILPPSNGNMGGVVLTKNVGVLEDALAACEDKKLYLACNIPEWLPIENELVGVDEEVARKIEECVTGVDIYELREVDEGYINSLLAAVDVIDEDVIEVDEDWFPGMEEPEVEDLPPFLDRTPTIVDINRSYRRFKAASLTYHDTILAQAGIKHELEMARAKYKRKSLAAIANWDKKSGTPLVLNEPYNDGANDDARAARSEVLFKEEFDLVCKLEEEEVLFEWDMRTAELHARIAKLEIERIDMILRLMAVTTPTFGNELVR